MPHLDTTTTENSAADPPPHTRRPLLYLLILVVVGVILRLYRLDQQSLWLDEYPGVAYLDAPDASTYLLLFQMYLPEQAQGPVYYLIQYVWAHTLGTDLVTLRLLPLLFGVSAIPLLYLLGKSLYGSRAGLLAALCLALSPQHVWHAQEVRPYSMITPLVIISVYALLRALRERQLRWWAVNLAVNCIMVWTHVFSALVIGIEGLLLLLFIPRWPRPAIMWASLQLFLLIPWFMWMAHMPFTYTGDMVSYHHSVRGVVNGIFANDVVSRHSDLLPPWKTHVSDALSPNLRTLLHARPFLDILLTLLLLCSPVWLVSHIVQLRRRKDTGAPVEGKSRVDPSAEVLLLLLLILPALTLGILTFVTKRPFLSPMYSMYNTIAIYVAFGALFTKLRRPSTRAAAVIFVTLLYGYQLAILLPEVTRTNWRAAAAHLEEHASPDDLVLELEPFWPGEYLAYYLDGNGRVIERITTFQAACDRAAAFLRQSPADRESHVWLVFEQAFISWLFPKFDAPRVLDAGLAVRNLTAKQLEFPGHYNLQIYQIARAAGSQPRERRAIVPGLMPLDYPAILKKIGVSYPDNERQAAAAYALREEISIWPPLCRFFQLIHGLDLLERGQFELGEAIIDHTISTYPTYGLAYFAKGLARVAHNDCANAQKDFQNAFSRYQSLKCLFGSVATALCAGADPTQAQAEIVKLEKSGTFFTPALWSVLRARFGV